LTGAGVVVESLKVVEGVRAVERKDAGFSPALD
jgi:hypothetical protein